MTRGASVFNPRRCAGVSSIMGVSIGAFYAPHLALARPISGTVSLTRSFRHRQPASREPPDAKAHGLPPARLGNHRVAKRHRGNLIGIFVDDVPWLVGQP